MGVVALFLSAALLPAGCRDEKNRLSSIDNDKEIPTMHVDSLHIHYTEGGLLRMYLQAPVMQRFLLNEEPYSVFPNGLHIFFYTLTHDLESEIVADYALNKEKPEEMWQAVGNVAITNYLKQQSLYTDTLYWNRVQRTIYTYSRVRITQADGQEIIGYNGMNSDERFENYEIRNVNESHVYVDDTPQDSTAAASPAASVVAPAPPAPRSPKPASGSSAGSPQSLPNGQQLRMLPADNRRLQKPATPLPVNDSAGQKPARSLFREKTETKLPASNLQKIDAP
jgi:hypothetical protein